jgi:TonB-like protein
MLISLVFHGVIALAVLYLAARSGVLGKKVKSLTVVMEKPAEKPKPPEKPKQEEPKIETPKTVAKTEAPKEIVQAPPPPSSAVEAPPAAAPPAVDMSSFSFNEGGRDVTSLDPIQLYKSTIESAYYARWNRPENMEDNTYEAEVEVSVDRSGALHDPVWKKGSGNSKWDDSVRQAIASTKAIMRPPPTNFPSHFTVKFDVAAEQTEVVQ